MGTSDTTPTPPPWSATRDALGNILLTFPRVLNADDVILSIESVTALGGMWAPADATLQVSGVSGNVATETWRVIPPSGVSAFFVRLKGTQR
jgi:hypothetical protein